GGFGRPQTGTDGGGSGGAPPPTGTGAGRGSGRRGGFFGGPPPGVSSATFAKAQQACASKRPRGGFGFGRGGAAAPSASALAAFRSCLASHGVKLASGNRGFGQLDRSDPKVQSALRTCSVLLPQRGRPPGTGTTTTSS